jgi:hypothetical protein
MRLMQESQAPRVRFDMLRFRFDQDENAADSVVDASKNRSVAIDRRTVHRWFFGLAITASLLALLAVSLGFATVGVSIYVAAILPFAFFS